MTRLVQTKSRLLSPRLFGWFVACAALAGCALDVQAIRYPEAATLAARPADCDVRIVDWHRTPEPGCEEVGDVYVGDRGMRLFGCGQERIEREIREEACRLGANLAMVRRIRDFISPCYQARARILHCPSDATAGMP